MDRIYLKIWQLAKPYYRKGRSYNIAHVWWQMRHADKIAELEKLDKKLLLPIIILHDVGYAMVKQKNPNIKDRASKKLHMQEGAKIARQILEKVGYDPLLTQKIAYYVSVHDNWSLGDDTPYRECREMAVFNDLDFLFVTSQFRYFKIFAQSMEMTPSQFYRFWLEDEKLKRRPFATAYTQRMWGDSMRAIGKQLSKSGGDKDLKSN